MITWKNAFFQQKCVHYGVGDGAEFLLLWRCAVWFVLLGGLILFLEDLYVVSMNENIEVYYGSYLQMNASMADNLAILNLFLDL